MKRLAIVCAVAASALASAAVATAAGPTLPLGHAGRWITDASGRVVVFHGVNEVYKYPPFYPAANGFGNADAAFLAANGFNAVRVGVLWQGVEPEPGVFDPSYVAQIMNTVNTLARHGIVSLLDFHQDLLNQKFGGEGWPAWAVLDDGLPAAPLSGFPLSYLTSVGLNAAMSNFYANAAGPGGVPIQDRYAAAWRYVADRFAADKSVLGYDLFNEPWSVNTNALQCYGATGCPNVEQQMLAPAEARMMRAIRQVDGTHLLFYEPIVETQAGLGPYTIQNPTGDREAGMSFHVYCLSGELPLPGHTCLGDDQASLDQALANGKANGEALLETEWGATNDVSQIETEVSQNDNAMMGWMWWAFTGDDPTTSGGGGAQSIVANAEQPPTGSNVVEPTLKALVEPYPQVIAGTPQSWRFDRATSSFEFTYTTARAAANGSFRTGSVTQVSTPALVYPHGYGASVSGGAVVSRPGAGTLVIAACRGARTITVNVNPGGVRRGSCRARLRAVVSPRRFRAGHRTTLKVLVEAFLGRFVEPVADAIIAFDGRRFHSGGRGRARIRVTLRDRDYRVRASARGFASSRVSRLRPGRR